MLPRYYWEKTNWLMGKIMYSQIVGTQYSINSLLTWKPLVKCTIGNFISQLILDSIWELESSRACVYFDKAIKLEKIFLLIFSCHVEHFFYVKHDHWDIYLFNVFFSILFG